MITPLDDLGRWEAEVRDPADLNAEPLVRLRAGREEASYRLAPIPGGWAWRADAYGADGCGGGYPWTGPVPTRDDARECALGQIVRTLRSRPDGPASELADTVNPDQGELP